MGIRENPKLVANLPLDKDWIANCFLLPKRNKIDRGYISEANYNWLYFTSADTKFANSSLGGNFTINNPPQFTIYADPPTGLLAHSRDAAILASGAQGGMGTYYSEAIDDNAHRVTMRFGVPQYKGLITFFTGFYNADMALLANQGRTSRSLFYFVGMLIGTTVMIGLNMVIWLFQSARAVLGRPNTSYYWLKPAMPLYWSRVNLLANRVAANLGIVPEGRFKTNDGKYPLEEAGLVDNEGGNISQDWEKWGKSYQSYSFEVVREFMPELFNDTGGIDVFRVINKANRMQARAGDYMQSAAMGDINGAGKSPKEQFDNAVVAYVRNFNPHKDDVKGWPLSKYLAAYHESILGAKEAMIDGEMRDITYRDAITDRIAEIAKQPPQALGDAQAQQAPAVDANGQPIAPDPAQPTDGTQPAAATPAAPANGQQPQQAPAQPTKAQIDEKRTRDEQRVKEANEKLAKAKKESKDAPFNGGIIANGNMHNSKIQAAEKELAAAKAELAKPPQAVTNDQSVNQMTTTAGAEIPLAGGLSSAPITGSAEAKELMNEYMKQDTLIMSALSLENEEEGILTRVLGWLADKSEGNAVGYFMDHMKRSGDWISYKTEFVTDESESWSNSVGESEIQATINGASSTVRAARMSFSNFQTGFSIIDGPIQAIRDTIAGLMSGFHVDGLLALAGTGAVDIPKRYMDSSSTYTANRYSMELRTPCGDPLSIFLHLYLPLLTLMGGALPISHGNQSYGQPLLLEMYVRGRSSVRLGIITDLSVTRGGGTVSWTDDGLPLGLDVQFTVQDLNPIMHIPIDTGLQSLAIWKGMANNDSVWYDYMAVLGNLTIYDQTNWFRRIAMRWAAYRINIDTYFNHARLGFWAADFRVVRAISSLAVTPPKILTM